MALLTKMVGALVKRATRHNDTCIVGAGKSRLPLPFALLRRVGCCCGVNNRAVQRIAAGAVMGPRSDHRAEFWIAMVFLRCAEGAEGRRVGWMHHSPRR